MADTSSEDRSLIPTRTAARLLMVSPERVRQLIRDGYIERAGRDRVPLVGAVQGYIRFREDADRRAVRVAAASRAQEARAIEIEQKVAARRGDLIGQAELGAALDFLLDRVREELEGLAPRIPRRHKARRRIASEARASAARIADAADRARAFAADGGPPPQGRAG